MLILVYRKVNVGNSWEEFCDIEIVLLFLKNNNVFEIVFINIFEGIYLFLEVLYFILYIYKLIKIFVKKKIVYRNYYLILFM